MTRARAAFLALILSTLASASTGTITGQFVTPMSGAVANATLALTLDQSAIVAGSYAVAPSTVSCYTDSGGNVRGLPDPTVTPIVTTSTAAGSLPSGTYFVQITYAGAGGETNVSPEYQASLASPGELIIAAPLVQPGSATSYKVYIGATSGGETLQGTVTGTPGSWSSFTQSSALAAGAAVPASNSSVCSLLFNDSLIPSYTAYQATLSQSGVTLPGYPQWWYLSGSTVDVSNITPLSENPAVRFPQPVLQNPTSAAQQSIRSPLTLNNYALHGTSNAGPAMIPAFWPSNLPAAGTTINEWQPQSAITIQRLNAFAQTAGGGTGTDTFEITDGSSTCAFAAMFSATAVYGTAAGTGTCNFPAGDTLSLKLSASTRSGGSEPANVQISVEAVAQ